ncbi:MAG TPA: membrane protein insertase YidC [Pirellulales bacterium]
MDKQFQKFLLASVAVLIANFAIMWWMQKHRPPAAPRNQANQAAEKRADGKGKIADGAGKDAEAKKLAQANKPGDKRANAEDDGNGEAAPKPRPAAQANNVAAEWVTLGSGDPAQPYRMLVTLTNRGAAVERIELNSPRFHDIEDRGGYLGHLEGELPKGKRGCRARIVGLGTPADRAGVQAGDIITAFDGEAIGGPIELELAVRQKEPGDVVELSVDRKGKQQSLSVALARRPLEVVRPEGKDPLSFLLTMQSIDGTKLDDDESELPGLALRTGNWTVRRDPKKPDQVAFEWRLDDEQLKITKTYSIDRLPQDQQDEKNAPAYHLNLRVEIENTSDEAKKVAYRLDGPTGLPTEGWWYAYSSKIGHEWTNSPGIRDVVLGYEENGFKYSQIMASRIADDKLPPRFKTPSVVYAGVDAQYFASVLIPRGEGTAKFAEVEPIRVGPVPDDKYRKKLVDVSCRLISEPAELAAGAKLAQDFQIFAGPKRPELLAQYAQPQGLGDLVYYGWFGWVSIRMLAILHFFYGLVGNYGLSIIMLTVLVRSCIFPISRKQAMNAAKMQELQPEMKKIAEKYKNAPEQRLKAQQELYRKHNFHPLSGCLPALIQLPIFLGLYRSLSVDIELRQAPLISESVRWCSNLGAPDMLWYWQRAIPWDYLTGETGWLGPYLNILPLVTISLFIWQQKMFLPPPADEQAAMQQKMMQYMMIFMGVMFFKVASGLCLYFIASSLWGIAERKLLPKTLAKPSPGGAASAATPARANPAPTGNGSAATRKQKQRERK